MFGYKVKCDARTARNIAAILSPTRNFVAIDRGVYFMDCTNDVQVDRDIDFILTNHLLTVDRIEVVAA